MAITQSGTSITFNDATTQTTAFTGPTTGGRGQVFTASGTFTIPSGVTALKVTVVGGGGGGGGNIPCCANTPGTSGNTSSVSSGSQTISTVSATGGQRGYYVNPYPPSAGGSASGGDLNITGGIGNLGAATGGSTVAPGMTSGAGVYGQGGSGNEGGGAGGTAIKYLTGLTPGGTLSVTRGAGGAGGSGTGGYSGGNGVIIFEW